MRRRAFDHVDPYLAPAWSDPPEPSEEEERMSNGVDAVEVAQAAIVGVVGDHLSWNELAYGKAWTGEDEDTEFICQGAADAVLVALTEAGWQITKPAFQPAESENQPSMEDQ